MAAKGESSAVEEGESFAADALLSEEEVSASRRRRRGSKKAPAPTPASGGGSSGVIDKLEKKVDDVQKDVKSINKKLDALDQKLDNLPAPQPNPAPPPPPPPPPPSERRRRRGPRAPPPAPPPPAPSPSGGGGGGAESASEGTVPKTLTERWLNAHNYWRCIHNTGPMVWDPEIAKGAQGWVDAGHTGHADCYNLPNPQGPVGENIAGGTGLGPEMASAMWHDENPERGPRCGGHCTAMLWKSAPKLGCGWKKGGMMNRAVCRYGGGTPLSKRLAANFGGSRGNQANVKFPDNSRKDLCLKKWPPAEGEEHSKKMKPMGGMR